MTEAAGAWSTRRKELWQQTEADEHQSTQSRCFRKTIQKKLRNRSREGTGKDAKITSLLGSLGRGRRRMACQTFSADSFTPLALDSPLPILMHHVSTSDCLPTTSHAHSMLSPGNLTCFSECHCMFSTLEMGADKLESTHKSSKIAVNHSYCLHVLVISRGGGETVFSCCNRDTESHKLGL